MPISPSEKDKSFRVYLREFWRVHVQLYLARESRKYLDSAVRVERNSDGGWIHHGSPPEIDKIVKERGLNSEQEKDLRKLIGQRTKLFRECFMEMSETRQNLYYYGGNNKPFWMEAYLNNFVKTMREGMEKRVDGDAKFNEDMRKLFDENISDVELKKIDDSKRAMKDLIGKVFAEFEKDLRDVQKDLMIYWEASKQWWEKRPVIILQVGLWVISVISSGITIYTQGLPEGWELWYWLVIGGWVLLVIFLIFSPQIEELKGWIQKWKLVQWLKKKRWEWMSRREQEKERRRSKRNSSS